MGGGRQSLLILRIIIIHPNLLFYNRRSHTLSRAVIGFLKKLALDERIEHIGPQQRILPKNSPNMVNLSGLESSVQIILEQLYLCSQMCFQLLFLKHAVLSQELIGADYKCGLSMSNGIYQLLVRSVDRDYDENI